MSAKKAVSLSSDSEDEEPWVIEKILDQRDHPLQASGEHRQQQFLVQWKGQNLSTWEIGEHIHPNLLEKWRQENATNTPTENNSKKRKQPSPRPTSTSQAKGNSKKSKQDKKSPTPKVPNRSTRADSSKSKPEQQKSPHLPQNASTKRDTPKSKFVEPSGTPTRRIIAESQSTETYSDDDMSVETSSPSSIPVPIPVAPTLPSKQVGGPVAPTSPLNPTGGPEPIDLTASPPARRPSPAGILNPIDLTSSPPPKPMPTPAASSPNKQPERRIFDEPPQPLTFDDESPLLATIASPNKRLKPNPSPKKLPEVVVSAPISNETLKRERQSKLKKVKRMAKRRKLFQEKANNWKEGDPPIMAQIYPKK